MSRQSSSREGTLQHKHHNSDEGLDQYPLQRKYLPNSTTLQAINDVENNHNLYTFSSPKAFEVFLDNLPE